MSNGFQLGQQLKAEMALVSIVDTTVLLTDGAVTPRELANSIKNDYKKNQQLLIDKLCKDCKIWTFVEEGKPFEAILKVADDWDADLIVLGTHGRTGLSHILIGSVAEKIVRHSTKPIFIIPIKL
ncbi:MAG: universal stress protein UspA [Bacteroidetes bacterium RIFCSPLOWO2_12_FULL_35_15]|nr:MAG: universal stress protein UspA [Bacteroidetes bacterium RIFCSPLOWO2_12_FULL_35_15]